MGKKKKKEFDRFRKSVKSPYKTIKTTLKSILRNKTETLPCINNLVCELNDLVIHSYQFIRLYVLQCYNNSEELPKIDEKFITYCIKTLGVKTKQGRKSKDTELLERLNTFCDEVYKPLLNYNCVSLKNKSKLISYLATQIHTSLHNNIQERFCQHFLRFINKTTTHLECTKPILFQFKKHLFQLGHTNELFDEWK